MLTGGAHTGALWCVIAKLSVMEQAVEILVFMRVYFRVHDISRASDFKKIPPIWQFFFSLENNFLTGMWLCLMTMTLMLCAVSSQKIM